MRQLSKQALPSVLEHDGPGLTAAYGEAVAAGRPLPTPWRHTEIVGALNAETHGKCAYCEAAIGDVAAAHVEHVFPKAHRPDLVVEWTNLTLACPNCNNAKGDYYSSNERLLHPYQDDPARHLTFAGPAITGKSGDDLGRRTVGKLRLMRAALILERAKRIEWLDNLLDRWHRAEGFDEQSIWEEAVHEALKDSEEFVGILREYARQLDFPVRERESYTVLS